MLVINEWKSVFIINIYKQLLNHMRKILLSLLGVLLISAQLLAQSRTITGRVTDENGNGIPNASVLVKGSSTGTTTDNTGNFTLTVPANAKTLVISSVGMTNKEVSITSNSMYSISLSASTANLEEVFVVGYSTSTKEAFTGSAKQVSGEQLNNKNVSNVSQALAGEVAGVRVINTSGQPGTVGTIRIRGIGSVNGNRDPLYVVDGVPFSGGINSINPEDIASVTVLKDAAATAIYGSRGANGVIVITTRTGKGKKSFIDVDGKFGSNLALLPRYSVIRSPEEYIALSWEAMYNWGGILGFSNQVGFANNYLFSDYGISPNNNIWNVTNGADLIDPTTKTVKSTATRKYDPEKWEDYAFQSSNRVETNVRMGGGDNKTNYYSSIGYLKDVGYSINSDFERLTGRVNLNHEVKPWLNTSFNVNYANSKSNNNGQESNSNSVFWFVDNLPPIYPLFLRDNDGNKVPDLIFGGYQYDYGSTGRKFGSLTNAIADATYNTLRTIRNELTGNASINLKFGDFSIDNRLGLQYYNNDYVERTNKFYGSAASQNGSIYQSKNELVNLNLLNMLRYKRSFSAHNVEVLAAHEATRYDLAYSSASGYSLVDNYGLELANAIVINPTATSYKTTNRLESYFGQVNYDYDGTYYLAATVRRDGSSRFIEGNAWGTFGSLGLGWEVSRMNFMSKLPILNYLKFKASYGILGDQEGLGYYPGYSNISVGNLNDQPSFGIPVPGNKNLTWETSKMFQTGIEFRLGNFLTGAVDYYVKNTDNLIFNRRVGISNGFALITVNDGKLRNQGIEFDLTFHALKKKDYYLDLGINGEHYTNKITAMPIDPSTGKQKIIDVQAPYGWAVGHSVYDFYIREFAGVDPEEGVSTWTVYYDDKNGDKQFNSGEQVTDLETFYANNPDKKGTLLKGTTKVYQQATLSYIGKSALPKVRGAFNLSGGWKGISVNVQLLYSLGGYAYDYAYAGLMGNDPIGGNNWSTDILKRWQKTGDVTDVPRLSNDEDANVNSSSSRFITKANYLILNNVKLAYSLPERLVSRIGAVEHVSVWVSGDNLWLNSARKGFNPATAESGASDMYRYSPLSTITAGINLRF
jgi:TonB-linked SusC/RagA family outer membrane protein